MRLPVGEQALRQLPCQFPVLRIAEEVRQLVGVLPEVDQPGLIVRRVDQFVA